MYFSKNYRGVNRSLRSRVVLAVAIGPSGASARPEMVLQTTRVQGASYNSRITDHANKRNRLRDFALLRKIPPGQEGVEPVPKEKPKVNIGEVIRSYRGSEGFLRAIS